MQYFSLQLIRSSPLLVSCLSKFWKLFILIDKHFLYNIVQIQVRFFLWFVSSDVLWVDCNIANTEWNGMTENTASNYGYSFKIICFVTLQSSCAIFFKIYTHSVKKLRNHQKPHTCGTMMRCAPSCIRYYIIFKGMHDYDEWLVGWRR